jgi:hypothetical protein
MATCEEKEIREGCYTGHSSEWSHVAVRGPGRLTLQDMMVNGHICDGQEIREIYYMYVV